MLYLPYEIWRDVRWYEWSYIASSMWRIVSIKFWRRREMIWNKCDWYIMYWLCKDWIVKNISWHRIIYSSFKGSTDYKKDNLCICHINDIRSDNRILNLWAWTKKENNIDCVNKNRYLSRYKNIYFRKGTYNYRMRIITCLGSTLWRKMRSVYRNDTTWKDQKIYESLSLASRDTGVDRSDIHKCCKWINKTAWWYCRSYTL